MPRLFTGLELPADLRKRLEMLQSGFDTIRWVEPADFHITLRFIGDVPPSTADAICEALDSRTWPRPTVVPGELRTFGHAKPSSLYLAIREDAALSRLAAGHDRLMQRLGLPADGRRFTPHITLGRFRGGTRPEMVAQWLAANGAPFALPFRPERFVLYSARESTGGGPYRMEESWPLEEETTTASQ